ncbi:hypothetical_protein [Leishmania braziliensis MHOM/BR/75/M2904]|uniref:Hypothetical_protein n=1 Tax=Leishmania braziliensis MHOM/BR/75/M2904 TaxID=420245 RepID=A0A3P3ZGA5_LEIBR|nr:unnamed protein product [Leishmania braziliensis]SYZ69301.1 hypothetical_protein [Leishmania braziliensis MHOM/BR/75/M2904]
MLQKKQTSAGRDCPKASAAFDPVAYAASIAISAAEKRLRASHMQGASSSTARPSSVHRPLKKGALVEDQQRAAVVSSSAVVTSVVDRSIVSQPTAATSGPLTLLEELACASDSCSSVDVSTPPTLIRAVPHNSTPVDVSHSASARSPSPPTSPPPKISPDPTRLANRVGSTLSEQEKLLNAEADEDDDGTVSLRDASPLREHSVSGSTGIHYHTCSVESVHTVVHQLNFALYR